MRGHVRGIAASAVAVFLASAGALLASGTMKLVAAAAPLPKDTKPIALSGLTYQTKAWISEVKSIRLKEMPEEGTDKVDWILGTRSTQSRLQKIEVDLYLLDAAGERVANAHQALVLLPQSPDAEQKVKMKLPAGAWSQARTVRIEVRFSTL
jgi:hypothetical protein